MKEKLDSLYLIDLKKSKRYEHFFKDLEEDPFVNNYLYSDFSNLSFDQKTDKIEVGNTYIVSYDGKHPIGLLRLHCLSNLGVLTLHYGIHPDFRRKGYGSKLLKEASSYLFDHFSSVNSIELNINPENVGSIKCAQNAGFKEEDEVYSVKCYRKTKTIV